MSGNIMDLDTNFREVLNGENYNELEFLRKKPVSNNAVEQNNLALTQRTNVDMKLSAEEFRNQLSKFGYPAESDKVFDFLKGVGEYDGETK